MTVGKGTNIFALADKVNLVITPQYEVPTQIAFDKGFVIKGEGKVEGSTNPTTINGDTLPRWSYDNKTYFVIGKGDLLIPKSATYISPSLERVATGTQYHVYRVKSPNPSYEAPIFNGSDLQNIKAGNQPGKGSVMLTVADTGTDLATFKVKVVSSQVATAGSSVNRKLTAFVTDFQGSVTDFLKKATNGADNSNDNAGGLPFGTNISPLNANISNTASSDVTIHSLRDLERYKHNGNANVYAVKFTQPGKTLVIDSNLQIDGVKTLLVENGNIKFSKNVSYASSASNASWAFIAKGGNIEVSKDVTNLSGVFVAIQESSKGGKITQQDVTSNILRIDGSVYGDAKELFEKRTYARGSSAYEILTTGTVLNYSNRALRNPPPLLSTYLNHYKVQRVVNK